MEERRPRHHPDARRPTLECDPTKLSQLILRARPSNANFELPDPDLEAEIADGTPPPTRLDQLERRPERVEWRESPVDELDPPTALEADRRSLNTILNETLELPLGELALDETETQPLEEVRAQREQQRAQPFLRIDTTFEPSEVVSEPLADFPPDEPVNTPVLQPTAKRAATSHGGTSVSPRASRLPWVVCGVALAVAAALTVLLLVR